MGTNYYETIDLKHLKFPKGQEKVSEMYEAVDGDKEPVGQIQCLKRINFFVGANNTGKSRLMRSIFNGKKLLFAPYIDKDELARHLEDFEKSCALQNGILGANVGEMYNRVEALSFWRSIVAGNFVSHDDWDRFSKILEDATDLANDSSKIRSLLAVTFQGYGIASAAAYFESAFKTLVSSVRSMVAYPRTGTGIFRHVYIPTIRSLRIPQDKNLLNMVNEDYGFFIDDNRSVIERETNNGMDIYDKLTDYLLHSSVRRKAVIEYEKFLSEVFFENREVHITPNNKRKVIYLKIGESKDIEIYNLGDGLQSLILLTFDAFFADQATAYFVEEPELYIHPGLQRKLVDLISRNPTLSRHQWFFTTHSNHLLDLTLDYSGISIFLFQKKMDEHKVQVQRIPSGHSGVLAQLGVLGSSVFRTNCLIWVEGVTDRRYLRAALSEYIQKKALPLFEEDIHFSFIEFGGGNITHFDFSDKDVHGGEEILIKFICERSFVVIDGDNRNKSKRVEALLAQLGRRLFVIPQKEIESCLPQELVQKVAENWINSSLKLKDKRDTIVPKISGVQFDEYSAISDGIGRYLDRVILDEGEKYFSTESGTIDRKVKFCNDVLNCRSESGLEILTDPLDKLCEKIYDFISEAHGVGIEFVDLK